jgi:hypothetical protein
MCVRIMFARRTGRSREVGPKRRARHPCRWSYRKPCGTPIDSPTRRLAEVSRGRQRVSRSRASQHRSTALHLPERSMTSARHVNGGTHDRIRHCLFGATGPARGRASRGVTGLQAERSGRCDAPSRSRFRQCAATNSRYWARDSCVPWHVVWVKPWSGEPQRATTSRGSDRRRAIEAPESLPEEAACTPQTRADPRMYEQHLRASGELHELPA